MALTKVKGSILSDELYRRENNLSDILDKARARTNLGIYSTTDSDNRYLNESSNLSDLDNKSTARNNLDVYSKGEVNTKIDEIPPPIQSIWAGELRRFSFDTPPPGFFELDGSTITNGKIDYTALANCGSRFITISGNNIVLEDYVDFGRGKGSSNRAVGVHTIDSLKSHTHTLSLQSSANSGNGGGKALFCASGAIYYSATATTDTYGGSETSPKSLTELVCIYHGVI